MRPRSLLLASAALFGLTGPAAAELTLHILHINDFHSRIESINRFDSTCSAEDEAQGACFGGSARLYTLINQLRDELRAEGQHVLVLDAGDQAQGSLFHTVYRGAAEAEMMNVIGIDAMLVGNHEFNFGPEPLAGFADKVEFPVIAGSLDTSNDPRLDALLVDHSVLEIGGERVAIVGAVTTDTVEISSPGPTLTFRDEIGYLIDKVEELTVGGVDKIIALTHVGLPRDLEIAQAVPGLDVIIGGHSHTLMSNTTEGAPAYPQMVGGPTGEVPVAQAYAYGKYVGHLVVTFDDDGRVTTATGDTILVDASVEPDPVVLARIAELGEPIEAMKAGVVGRTAADIDGSRETCRAMECPMGNLVAEAMVDRVRDQGVTIAIQNGGGLRASIGAGEVTMGEVLSVLPFQNTLATFELTGAGILAALENGFSEVEEGAGRFPQVAGLRVTWDPAAEPGSRVTEVLVEEAGGWVPIEPDAVYGVASNNFMRKGGDGYAMFRDDALNAYDFGPGLEDVLAAYLGEQGTYTPFVDGRIATRR